MQFVSRDHVGRCAHAQGVSIDDSLPRPSLPVEAPEHYYIATAHGFELFQQICPGAAVELRRGDIVVLFEARQFGAIVACDTQRPVGENALGIDHVAYYLAHTPFSVGVTLQGVRIGNSFQVSQRAIELGAERAYNVAVRHQVHVAAEVRSVFGGDRSSFKKVRHT